MSAASSEPEQSRTDSRGGPKSDSTDEAPLLHELRDGVLRITLNRPGHGNAIAPDQRDELIGHLEQASEDLRVRCVILRANGKHFCTGADLASAQRDLIQVDGAPARPVGWVERTIRTGAQRLVSAVLDCEKPVIAAVHGAAAGIGAHLALAADLVVADRSARFIEVFARRGIVPDGAGAYLLTRLVGLHLAKQWAFFADDISVDEAERTGLVNRVVAEGELDGAVDEWALRLAGGPTIALSWTKRLINAAADQDRAGCFAQESAAQEIVRASHDAGEGMTAFRERREAIFRGF